MVRAAYAFIAAIALVATATPGIAAPCKDARGKFVKCPPAKPQPKRCKDHRGKFAKCGTPGARPI